MIGNWKAFKYFTISKKNKKLWDARRFVEPPSAPVDVAGLLFSVSSSFLPILISKRAQVPLDWTESVCEIHLCYRFSNWILVNE